MADDVVTGYERIKMEWPRGGTLFQRTLAEQLPPSDEFYGLVSDEEGLASLVGAIGAAREFLTGFGRAAIVIVLSMYWSADRRRFEQLTLSLLPAEHDERFRNAWEALEDGIGAYIRMEAVQSVLTGLILGPFFWLLGAPYPALFALWAATARLVPWFGVILAILPSLIAMLVGAPVTGALSAAFTLLVLVGLRLTAGSGRLGLRRYNALWILAAVVAMAELWGFGGAVIAPVVGIAVQLLAEQFAPEHVASPVPSVAERVDGLRSRAAALADRLPAAGRPVPAETRDDLDRLRGRLEALAARSGD
jgi:predicted PurR-regulated permease PerM